jgi:O-acetyl-ADP-ribose deacetylase (regulator of RNase III)
MLHSLLSRQASTAFRAKAAARVAVTTIGSHLKEQQMPALVILVCFDMATFNAYSNAIGCGV